MNDQSGGKCRSSQRKKDSPGVFAIHEDWPWSTVAKAQQLWDETQMNPNLCSASV